MKKQNKLNPEITDPYLRKLRNLDPPAKGSREDYREHHENPQDYDIDVDGDKEK